MKISSSRTSFRTGWSFTTRTGPQDQSIVLCQYGRHLATSESRNIDMNAFNSPCIQDILPWLSINTPFQPMLLYEFLEDFVGFPLNVANSAGAFESFEICLIIQILLLYSSWQHQKAQQKQPATTLCMRVRHEELAWQDAPLCQLHEPT